MEVWIPEMGGLGVKVAAGRNAERGIQYCGNHLCSQTRRAEVVSKRGAPERVPRRRFWVGRIFGW